MKNATSKSILSLTALPILFCFFIMGFVDFVGTATNYVKQDFALSDTLANTLPMMVFIWFAIFSIPTGVLMNKIGRKNTVLLSLLFTIVGLMLPIISYSFASVLIAFGLIGIGNTILQTSLNPLVTNIVTEDRLASSLTLGQFMKAIASFLGPVLAAFTAKSFGDWKMTFVVFAITTILSGAWLFVSRIPREESATDYIGFGKTFSLLGDKNILLLFIGILAIVGVDVGLNTSIPKLLMYKTNIALENASMGTSCYFVARTIGAFTGAFLLTRINGSKFLFWSMLVAAIALAALLSIADLYFMYAAIFIIGFACANVFSIIFSFALNYKKDSANEISSLMITGVAGGALIMPIMGAVADMAGQIASMGVLFVCLAYMGTLSLKMK